MPFPAAAEFCISCAGRKKNHPSLRKPTPQKSMKKQRPTIPAHNKALYVAFTLLMVASASLKAATTYDTFTTNPNISTEWTGYNYYSNSSPGAAVAAWNSVNQNLDLTRVSGDWMVGLYRTGSTRSATDPVTMAVSSLSSTAGAWGFVGLTISDTRQSLYVTGGGADNSYTLAMVPQSTTTFRYEVRRTYLDGTGDFQLYIGPTLTFADSDPYDLDIVRSGDHYLFQANGATLYTTTGTGADFYTPAQKDAMVYYQVAFGGMSVLTATIDNFGVIPEPSAALLGGLGFLALLRRRR
jgi:hypothetical protein